MPNNIDGYINFNIFNIKINLGDILNNMWWNLREIFYGTLP